MSDWKYVDLAQGIPHGDILHSPSTANESTTNDLVYRMRPEDTTGGHPDPIGNQGPIGPTGTLRNDYHRGEVGWICPICGRGLAPSTSYCPCNLTRDITYLNGGLSIQDMTINCKPTPHEAYYTTTSTTKSN